ncbi:MAG TPA: nucleotidyltransferase family protein [Steroidobacteraceae bacterium]|nr:nucleotidyltransferase family protein [Steroidobacteraceae bacterium]
MAGGRSQRMGAHKLLLPLGDAPVIVQSVRAALASGLRPVVVVTGHEGDHVRAALGGLSVTIVPNAQYHEGIASSLRAGIAALGASVIGAVIMLGDQPLLPEAHLAALAARASDSGAALVTTRYGDHDGTPLFIARRVFAETLRLRGDQGARSLFGVGGHAIEYVRLDDLAAALDIDVPEDYVRAGILWQQRAGGPGAAGY